MVRPNHVIAVVLTIASVVTFPGTGSSQTGDPFSDSQSTKVLQAENVALGKPVTVRSHRKCSSPQ